MHQQSEVSAAKPGKIRQVANGAGSNALPRTETLRPSRSGTRSSTPSRPGTIRQDVSGSGNGAAPRAQLRQRGPASRHSAARSTSLARPGASLMVRAHRREQLDLGKLASALIDLVVDGQIEPPRRQKPERESSSRLAGSNSLGRQAHGVGASSQVGELSGSRGTCDDQISGRACCSSGPPYCLDHLLPSLPDGRHVRPVISGPRPSEGRER